VTLEDRIINNTGIGAYKDYIKFGECFQVGTL